MRPIDARTRPTRRTSPVVHVLVALLTLGGLLAVEGSPVGAQSTYERLQEAKRRYQAVQARLDSARAAFQEEDARLHRIEQQIAGTHAQIHRAEDRIHDLRGELKERIRAAYRMGGLGMLEFLLDAGSFRDFGLRMIILERQAAEDEDLLLEIQKAQGELKAKESVLRRQREEQAEVRDIWEARTQELNAALADIGALQEDLQQKYRAEQLAALYRSNHPTNVPGRAIPLQACPAKGPHSFSNDWGAPRGGGSRSHKGTDIFAPQGAPAAAVVSGRITRLSSGGISGLMVVLWGNDGNEYYYIHMSGFAVSQGQQVSAGQTIAYVGNSGNARGGPPHIHFEIHPGGGYAINPYPSLVRVC